MEHYWSDCPMCGPMVVCGKCGNNSCNAGYGSINGAECDTCPSAYDKQNREAAIECRKLWRRLWHAVHRVPYRARLWWNNHIMTLQ